MQYTKKQFQETARVLSYARPDDKESLEFKLWDKIRNYFVGIYIYSNTKFDTDKFLEATEK